MFVDLDDSRNGPAIQDLWMLLSGERSEKLAQLDIILEAYQEFNDFDTNQPKLIEPLRGLTHGALHGMVSQAMARSCISNRLSLVQ